MFSKLLSKYNKMDKLIKMWNTSRYFKGTEKEMDFDMSDEEVLEELLNIITESEVDITDNFKKAVTRLEKNYLNDLMNPWVKIPIEHALYETWRQTEMERFNDTQGKRSDIQ